jgi:hypothetical protein
MNSIDYLIKEFSAILGVLKTEPMQDLLLVDAMAKAKEMHYKELMDSMQRGMELQDKENNRIGFRERNGLLPQQKETLYTEEQVREAIELARETRWIPNCGNQYPYNHTCDEIIQSLKQPKKD